MIAVDTSAIISIVFHEAGREKFIETLKNASGAFISTVSVIEAKMVAYRRMGEKAVIMVDDLLKLPVFEITAPDLADMEAAHRAFVAFGKGSGHRAQLNFGDLFPYALAKTRNLPLLYKGNDFAQTDIQSALDDPLH